MSTTQSTPSPALSLGERCVVWCQRQAEKHPIPPLETLAQWFEPVGRGLESMVRAGQRLNHCAAAQCAAMQACILADEDPPHGYRAGAKQLRADAIERGIWHEVSECRAGLWIPHPGDLAIYDRSTPGRPETSWYGHVDRVVQAGEQFYANIGANEGPGGAWRTETTRYDHPRLLGFVAYPRATIVKPIHLLDEAQVQRIRALVSLTLDQAEAAWWDDRRKEPVT